MPDPTCPVSGIGIGTPIDCLLGPSNSPTRAAPTPAAPSGAATASTPAAAPGPAATAGPAPSVSAAPQTAAPRSVPTHSVTTGPSTGGASGGSGGAVGAPDLLHALLGWASVAGLVLLGIVCVALIVVVVQQRRALERTESARLPPPPAPAAVDLDPVVEDLIALADLAASPAVLARATRLLQRFGVAPVQAAPGQPYDADVFTIADTAPTDDAGLQHRVAEQMRPGWRRGGVLLRPADVRLWIPS